MMDCSRVLLPFFLQDEDVYKVVARLYISSEVHYHFPSRIVQKKAITLESGGRPEPDSDMQVPVGTRLSF